MAYNKNEDKFSYLSDSLLCNIISSLPFKEAARTSVLSKPWRYIWLSTQNIELDESFFVKQGQNKEIQTRAFLNFAKYWIDNYGEAVAHKFRLKFSDPKDNALEVHNCIQFAVDRKVKVLDLDFSEPSWDEHEESLDNHEASFELPSCVYQHANLESLKLFSCNIKVLQYKNFGALKSLCLGWIGLRACSVRALLSKCESLESLSLKKCWGLDYLDIFTPNLRTLVVENCLKHESVIVVDAKKLRFLKYSGPSIVFHMEYMNSMVEAVLDFGTESQIIAGEILCNLLTDIWCVQILSVCSYMLQVIFTGEDSLMLQPPLGSLQHLILKTALDVKEYYGISFFLNSCPRLETLSIYLGPANILEGYESGLKLQDHEFMGTSSYIIVYVCLKKTLKVVEVKGFKGETNELRVLEYFIKFGTVLEKMSITVSEEKGPGVSDMSLFYRQNAMRLLSLKKASPSLRILIG